MRQRNSICELVDLTESEEIRSRCVGEHDVPHFVGEVRCVKVTFGDHRHRSTAYARVRTHPLRSGVQHLLYDVYLLKKTSGIGTDENRHDFHVHTQVTVPKPSPIPAHLKGQIGFVQKTQTYAIQDERIGEKQKGLRETYRTRLAKVR